MLDEGLRAGLEFFGIPYRTACYVERETFAAAQLVKLMEAQCVDEAPIWDDLTTFDARSWRGKLDCITAGFPCQPHSVAGKREGLEDERWIWPDITRIIRESEPSLVWLENVPGLVSTGGLEQVLFDLARLGFNAEWGVLAASEVGASHQRERIFILAYRGLQHFNLQQWQVRNESARSLKQLANPADLGHERSEGTGRQTLARAEHLGDELADAMCQRRQQIPGSVPEHEGEQVRPQGSSRGNDQQLASEGSGMADTCRESLSRRKPRGSSEQWHGQASSGPAAELREVCLFAPGPTHPSWETITERQQHLAPATEPGLCIMADGLALVVDEFRADQLRAVGNGVVPLQAAAAFVLLAQRAGII